VISLEIASPKFALPLLTSFPPSRCHLPRRRKLNSQHLKKRSSMLTGDRLHIVSSSYDLSHFVFDFHSATQDLVCTWYPLTPLLLPPHCAQFVSPYAKDSSTILFGWEKFSSNALLNTLSDFALRKIATALFSLSPPLQAASAPPPSTVHSFHHTSTIPRLQARRKSGQS
jgi:hypothetical protein